MTIVSRAALVIAALVLCRASAWFGPIVLAAGGAWLLREWSHRISKGDRRFELLVLAIFFAHVAFATGLFVVSYFELPLLRPLQVPGGFWRLAPDSDGYHLRALALAEVLRTGGVLPPLTPTVAYELLIAVTYLGVGPVPLSGSVINAWLITATGLIAAALGRRWRSSPVCYSALVAVACWPSAFVWSSQLLRDCAAWFLTFAALWVAVAIFNDLTRDRRRAVWSGLALIFAVAVLCTFRPYAGWLMLGASGLVVLRVLAHPSGAIGGFARVAGVALLIAIGSVLGSEQFLWTFYKNAEIASTLGPPAFSPLELAEGNPQVSRPAGGDPQVSRPAGGDSQLPGPGVSAEPEPEGSLVPQMIEQKRRELLAGSNASIGASADVRSWERMLVFLPVGAATVLAGPFPWQIAPGRSTGVFKSMAVIEGVLLALMMPALLIGCLRAARSPHLGAAFVLAYGIVAVGFLGLIVPNLGGLVRLRPQALFPLFALALAFNGADVYRQILRIVSLRTFRYTSPEAV